MEPDDLVKLLNLIFKFFDELCGQLGLTKIKTIGDGMTHCVECAADFVLGIAVFQSNHSLRDMNIRVGMSYDGDVIA